VIVISEIILFSILVSLFTQGLGAAANNGGILYPVKVWMESINYDKLKKLGERNVSIHQYKEHRRRTLYQSGDWMDKAFLLFDLKQFYLVMWHKPLLSCMICMASFWGTVLYWSVFFSLGFPIYTWLVGIPIASSITLLTHKLRP
jgi:hypothetical protein